MLEKPTLENPMQLNKDISRTDLPKKEQSITDLPSTDSIPILSPDPSPYGDAAAEPPERKRKEAATQSAVELYREIIKENIEYEHLLRYSKIDPEELPCKTEWTSRRSPGCWGTTQRGLPWTPTPM